MSWKTPITPLGDYLSHVQAAEFQPAYMIKNYFTGSFQASFTTAEFLLDNYHQPFRLDINSKSGGILVYVKSSVPSRKMKCDVFLKSIQVKELNLRKEKWLVISQDSEFF